jgi:DNA primase
MVFDLDPGAGVAWTHVQEAALLTRALLTELGLSSWLKTSGGKGLHVVVPLAPRLSYDAVKDFSQAIVQHLVHTIPGRFVAKSGPANRIGRIFVDYVRNGHGATTAAAFSARARPGLGVSMPVALGATGHAQERSAVDDQHGPRASVLSEDRPVGRVLDLRADTDGGDEGPGLQGAPGETLVR